MLSLVVARPPKWKVLTENVIPLVGTFAVIFRRRDTAVCRW